MTGKTRIILTFCLSIALLLAIGFYSYLSTKKYQESYGWVDHTQHVISEAQKLSLNLQEMESAQRGFIITGNSRYLYPYNTASAEIDQNYKTLSRLVSDNETQTVLLDTIHHTLSQKVSFIKSTIEIRKKEGFRAAQKAILTNRGEDLMQHFRKNITHFITNEQTLLDQRVQDAKKDYQKTIIVIVLSILLAVIIVLTTLYFFIKDYNRRLRSKQRLIESENRIKKFLEALPVGIYVLDKTGKSYYSNSKANLLFGPDVQNNPVIENTDFREMLVEYKTVRQGSDELYPAMELPIMRALMGEKNIIAEDLELLYGDKRIPLRVNATSITNAAGEIEYAISVFEDVTDVREASQRLQDAIRLSEQAIELKETFLANMSHEIRTPMNAIIGFTGLLLKDRLNEQQRDYVNTIKTAGDNLLRIINDILDVSKIESGMMSFETHAISICDLMSSLQAMLQPKVHDKNLVLQMDCGADIPSTVLGDPTRLTQILLNLLGNAIKFTSKGEILVNAELQSETATICTILFSVKDTGIGISADKLDHIFDRFTQAESHTTRQYGGTGLGLSIAKQLIELQGGQIQVSSKPGFGSRFTFTIPFNKTTVAYPERSVEVTDDEIRSLSKKSILLVEDNPINVKLVQSLFAAYHIMADLAPNGKIAVSKMKDKKYDVVLMDIEMPEMNGYEATWAIRNELKLNTPIIAMTANAMAGESEKCLSLGMNAYISKPIREDYLFEKMVSLIAENEIQNPAVMAEKLTDLTYLVNLLKGNQVLILETLDVFLTQIEEDLKDLHEGFEKEDPDAIRRYAHRMKSTVSIIGAKKLEVAVFELEQSAQLKKPMEALIVLKKSILLMSAQAVEEIQSERMNYIPKS